MWRPYFAQYSTWCDLLPGYLTCLLCDRLHYITFYWFVQVGIDQSERLIFYWIKNEGAWRFLGMFDLIQEQFQSCFVASTLVSILRTHSHFTMHGTTRLLGEILFHNYCKCSKIYFEGLMNHFSNSFSLFNKLPVPVDYLQVEFYVPRH